MSAEGCYSFLYITSLDYVSTSPFRTLLDIIQRMAGGVFAALGAFYGQSLMACLSFLSISFFMPFLACRYINTSSAAISKIISAADGHPTCS